VKGPRRVVAAARRVLTDDKLQFAVAGLAVVQGLRYVFDVLAMDRASTRERLEEIEGQLDHARARLGALEGRQMARSALERASKARHPSVTGSEAPAHAEGPRAAP